MEVGMDLTQGAGADLVRGGELITVNCDAPSTAVTLTAPGTKDDGITSAPFRAGPADWRYDWNAITVIQVFEGPTVFGTLQLTGGSGGDVAGPTVTPPATDVAPPGSDGDGRTYPSGAAPDPDLDRLAVGRRLATPQAIQVPARMTRVTCSESSSSTRSARWPTAIRPRSVTPSIASGLRLAAATAAGRSTPDATRFRTAVVERDDRPASVVVPTRVTR